MDNNEQYIWYPDEDICSLRRFASVDWVRKQKLIVKKHGSVDGFFTARMLQVIKKVSKGITGANPDSGIDAEKRWFRDRGLPKSRGKSAMPSAKRGGKSGGYCHGIGGHTKFVEFFGFSVGKRT
jgi:hypothetical protein